MKVHPFDDRIKKRLQHHESEVPEDMWQRIMEKKKDRRFILLPRRYFLLALLFLIGTTTLFIYFGTSDHLKSISTSPGKARQSTMPKTTIKNENDQKNKTQLASSLQTPNKKSR